MSVSRECEIVEAQTGQWFLLLAEREHGELTDVDAFAVGPFVSRGVASIYLANHYSNPGGCTYSFGEPLTPTQSKLIASAQPPAPDERDTIQIMAAQLFAGGYYLITPQQVVDAIEKETGGRVKFAPSQADRAMRSVYVKEADGSYRQLSTEEHHYSTASEHDLPPFRRGGDWD